MAEQQCPFYERGLYKLEKDSRDNEEHFHCEECNLEFVKYPSSNKKGVQRTGIYLLLPLIDFSKGTWEDFLFTDRNIYGETIPDRMPCFNSPEERKEVEEERKLELQSRDEWQQLVG